jgi:hypothetical protein
LEEREAGEAGLQLELALPTVELEERPHQEPGKPVDERPEVEERAQERCSGWSLRAGFAAVASEP